MRHTGGMSLHVLTAIKRKGFFHDSHVGFDPCVRHWAGDAGTDATVLVTLLHP